MKKIAKALIPALGLISIVHLGCQGPTLVTTVGPPSSEAVEGMLYYLPTGKITIKGEYSPAASGGGLMLTVTASVEADQVAGIYYVTPKTNDIFDDEVQVTINTKHLLSAGKVTTEDKTSEIVGTIASIAATAVKGIDVGTPDKPFFFSFDPSNYDDVKFVREQLKIRQIGLTVKINGHNVIAEDIPVLHKKEVQRIAADLGQNGLVFRPAAVYSLRLVYPLNSQGNDPGKGDPVSILNTEQFISPDRIKVSVIKFDRMPFVKKVRDVGFNDGMLTDFHQKRPSPILGFLGIPKAIVQAIVPIPGAAPSGSGSAVGTSASQR